jgi:hypothetical protein
LVWETCTAHKGRSRERLKVASDRARRSEIRVAGLAAVYAVPYETLMEKAGYLPLSDAGSAGERKLAALAIDDVTAAEEEQLLKYLAFLRSRVARS